ncbi:MAG: hypothetical protein WCW44_01365 [archaeon]|jgi:predicted RNA-binding Zn-ribbon protein involved in translation (DUF1610 family)
MANVPRRLARFYRNGEAPEQTEGQNWQPPAQGQKEILKEDPFAPNGRPLLQEIPSMGYEDLTNKNYEEIRQVEQTNMEQKLALQEIEKFKRENNRMPTQKESDSIAESLFSQLKNSDMNALYPESAIPGENQQQTQRGGHRGRRGERMEQTPAQKMPSTQKGIPTEEPIQNQPLNEVKDLFGEEESKKGKKKSEDDFDLGLDEDLGNSGNEDISSIEDTGDIEDISLDDKSECPNCKKDTEHIVYCPKCGTAFCEKCGKKQGNEYTCPKCGTKTKG